jgi:hypothetical protein
MSVIEIKSHPVTHIIVRDFLESSSKEKLLKSLLPIRENHLKRLPSPPRKKKSKEEEWDQLEMYRVGCMLHDVLKENPTLNKDCVSILESNMGRDDIRNACEDTNDLLFCTHAAFSNEGAMLFSQYETGGKMIWHSDHGPVCSASYIFKFDDQDCLEGDFLLSGFMKSGKKPLQENIVTYPFEDNFLIIFPAKALHRVTQVIGYRNSIQYFAGYEGWKVLE